MLTNLNYDPEQYLFDKNTVDPKLYNELTDDEKNIQFKHTIEKLQDGVYEYWDVNNIILPNTPYMINSSFDNADGRRVYLPYGVCDNIVQIFERDERIKQYVDDPDNKFIIQMHYIAKKDCSPKWGWRWHKWGRYIGEHEITTEYLYDEPIVEGVWVYQMCIVTEK